MDYDYIIIGSGGAGLFAALLARRHGRVLVVTKDGRTECNTNYAQGGIAAAVGPGDSPEQHLADTLIAGGGLCDEEAVRVLVTEGPARVLDLIHLGLPFDRDGETLALGREGAHGRARILHAGGDATGRHIELTLDRVAQQRGIEVRDRSMVTEVLVENGEAVGVRLLDERSGREQAVAARFVVLASGGAGQLYSHTTNPAVATGDGVALGYRAGAAVADLEFYQFHPTALSLPGAPSFLISEAVRGAGAILRSADGAAFMSRYDPRRELASRDIVARAIVAEMARTGKPVYLDLTHLPPEEIRSHFPTISAFCDRHGVDITRRPVPVAPAAHYWMGGVVTDLWGETSVGNLFAAGECARSGVHGANRLASNSLLELLVFGQRVVQRTLVATADRRPERGPALPVQPLALPELEYLPAATERLPVANAGDEDLPSAPALRRLLWQQAGIVRGAAGLEQARRQLARWSQCIPPARTRQDHELVNLLLAGRLLVEAALARQESRGAHFRTDFPEPREEWRCHLVGGATATDEGRTGWGDDEKDERAAVSSRPSPTAERHLAEVGAR